MKNKFKIYIIGLLFSTVLLNSCSDSDLDPTLSDSKSVEEGISSADDLSAVILGMYNRFSSYKYYGRDYLVYGDVRSDNALSNGNSGRFINVAAFNITS